MSYKFLILGASGQLGMEFQQILTQRNISYFAPEEANANITDSSNLMQLIKNVKPEVVINCAAYNAVDDAETNPEPAFKVNAEAVGHLAEICYNQKVKLVHYSSDYVFDGKKGGLYVEDDPATPLNVYGKSKLAGEQTVLQTLPDALVFRLSWVIGKGHQNFLYKLTQWATKNPVLKISADETSVPSFTDDIVNCTLLALEDGLKGLYHLNNSGYASRYELTRYFFKAANLDNLIIPVSINNFKTAAERPLFSAMSNIKLSKAINFNIPQWQEGVDRYAPFFLKLL